MIVKKIIYMYKLLNSTKYSEIPGICQAFFRGLTEMLMFYSSHINWQEKAIFNYKYTVQKKI